mmetsp:Transcript_1866/g.1779  ORF Transcript_1866/g.1779 Transcript_1866/m.1779 type:complete len:101 (-) Transcript_1866:175-477(-)
MLVVAETVPSLSALGGARILWKEVGAAFYGRSISFLSLARAGICRVQTVLGDLLDPVAILLPLYRVLLSLLFLKLLLSADSFKELGTGLVLRNLRDSFIL